MSVFFKFNSDLDLCLQNNVVVLKPLQRQHFDSLFLVASDKLLWEQHPNPERYKLDHFTTFFEGALASDNAFLIFEKSTNEIIGCTRFYDYNEADKSVFIGYTFIARKFWGKGLNQQVKKVMIAHAFKNIDKILFHIGSENTRSQIAISRTGAIKIAEQLVEYFGEPPKLNFVYEISKNTYILN